MAPESYAEDDPRYYLEKALECKDGNPTILSEHLHNLNIAMYGEYNLDWNALFDLIEFIIKQVKDKKYQYEDKPNLLDGICQIIRQGFLDTTLPFKMKEKVLGAILKFIEINDADENLEFLRDEQSYFSFAINNLNGMAFQILCDYMMWYKDNNKSTKFVLEIKYIFDKYIENKEKHTISRHAVLGAYFDIFCKIDKKWAKTMLEKIDSSPQHMIAFWEPCVSNTLYIDTFDALHELYDKFLNGDILENEPRKSIRRKTAEHVTQAYLCGLDKTEEIIGKFLKDERNDNVILKQCFDQANYTINERRKRDAINKDRVKYLLNHDKFIRLGQMNEWLKNWIFSDKETIDIFLNYVKKTNVSNLTSLEIDVGALTEYVDDYPMEVTECLSRIISKQENKNTYMQSEVLLAIKDLLSIEPKHVASELKPALEKNYSSKNDDHVELLKKFNKILDRES